MPIIGNNSKMFLFDVNDIVVVIAVETESINEFETFFSLLFTLASPLLRYQKLSLASFTCLKMQTKDIHTHLTSTSCLVTISFFFFSHNYNLHLFLLYLGVASVDAKLLCQSQ